MVSSIAMKDVTALMNAYRECSRHLWNVYFSGREDVGGSLDTFEQIRQLLFDVLVLSELCRDADDGHTLLPVLKVVPQERSIILIRELNRPAEAGYWEQEKDLVVGPGDITLAWVDYFDFAQVPVKDYRYYHCKILSFPNYPGYEGREALLEVAGARVFHDPAL